MPAAWGPPTWNPPARAGPRHQSQALGCWRSPPEAPQRSHRLLPSPRPPGPGFGQWGSPLLPPPHPQPFPDKAAELPAPQRGGGPDIREEPRAESASRRRAAVRSPPLACPPGAGLGRGAGAPPAVPPAPAPGRCGAAGRRPGRPALPHPRAPRVRAAGLQMLPGWRHRDFCAAPPSLAATLRALHLESPWRLAAASKTRRRLCKPGCPARLRAAARSPRLPPASGTHLFLWTMGFGHCAQAFSHGHGLLEGAA